MLKEVRSAIVDLKIEAISDIVRGALDAGISPIEIMGSLSKGMEEVGEKFEARELFLAELVMAGETMKEALKVLRPYLKMRVETAAEGETVSEVAEFGSRGKVVLGTIEGDMHDIGKDIISILLTSAGFTVYDLGIDVPPEAFVKKAKEVDADIVGISALLSITVPTSEKVVEALKNATMRNRVKVILGGGAVRKWAVKKWGVDAATNDAMEGLRIIKSWMEEKR